MSVRHWAWVTGAPALTVRTPLPVGCVAASAMQTACLRVVEVNCGIFRHPAQAFATACQSGFRSGLTPYPGVCEEFRLHAAAVYCPAGDVYPKASRPDNQFSLSIPISTAQRDFSGVFGKFFSLIHPFTDNGQLKAVFIDPRENFLSPCRG